MLGYPQTNHATSGQDTANPLTVRRLLIIWSVLTDQPAEEFIPKIASRVQSLYIAWRHATGCVGLSDTGCARQGEFWSGFWRTLINATPENNLLGLVRTGTGALAHMMGQPGLEDDIDKLLHQVTGMISTQTVQDMTATFEANPKARAKLAIPELEALVLREEIRLGWKQVSKEQALHTLETGLSPETKNAAGGDREVLRHSLESISRRGLYNNLIDALNGQLRQRFIKTIRRFAKAVVNVKSTWEFGAAALSQETFGSIRSWLFRR